MSYEAEKIAAALKAAREKKGLTQRELSARAGVPQSHISKIETGGVNLRISSLAAIANALDLEIALVPRKAVPAIKSIARSVDDVPRANPDAKKELTRIAKQLEHFKELNVDMSAIADVQRRFRELQQFQNLLRDTGALRRIRETLKAYHKSDSMKALREAGQQMSQMRNTLAHPSREYDAQSLPRPAYSLDGDDDG